MIKHTYLVILLGMISFTFVAQETEIRKSPLYDYNKGLELYDKEEFSAAYSSFKNAMRRITDPSSEAAMNSKFYMSMCSMELFHRDAENQFKEFLEDYPESPKVKIACFQLGIYSFRKRKWNKVIEWFDEVDIYDLDNDQLAEYYFKKGYAWFQMNEFDKSEIALYEIKDIDTDYTTPARYYYSHIQYHKKKYQNALDGFLYLAKDPDFGPVVPYYITQIYYMQEKYFELIEYAPRILDSTTTKRGPEIARLIGESYYRLGKYKECVPYLEKHRGHVGYSSRQDHYQLGYALYKIGEWNRAIRVFENLVNIEDELTQTVYYHMADCYLKSGNKKYARNTFKAAYDIEIDEDISRNSLFAFAKLSFELSYDPYHGAMKAFKDYLDKYPDSQEAAEVVVYMTNVYLTTKNYKQALNSLEEMKPLNPILQEVYQWVVFNLGVDRLRNNQYSEAIDMLQLSRTYPVKSKLTSLSYYWEGEANYQLSQLPQAIQSYKIFLFKPGAILQKEFAQANFNIGYAYYKMKDYQSCIPWFRKYTSSPNISDSLKLCDANIRVGDAYFIDKNYYYSIEYYDKAAKIGLLNPDYALFQKSIAFGLTNKNENKVAGLKNLISKYPESLYFSDALYHLGNNYMLKGKNDSSLYYFTELLENDSSSSYFKRTLLNIGQIHYNVGNYPDALSSFKSVVSHYPNFIDSRVALTQIRNIYTKIDGVPEYESYMASLDFVDISKTLLDSTNYDAAYLHYVNGDCRKASEGFKTYLSKFPGGVFSVNANFYLGECHYTRKDFDSALDVFENVIHAPSTKFREKALLKAARICIDKEVYSKSLTYYKELEKTAEYPANVDESVVGIMRSSVKLGNWKIGEEYANRVLKLKNLNDENTMEANMILADSKVKNEKFDEAYAIYKLISDSSKGEMAAKAKYTMAELRFHKGEIDSAEFEIYEMVNSITNEGYWLAKGLILLADVYARKGDYFQARQTLMSIIENYEGEDLKSIASENLDKIVKMQQKEEEIIDQEEIEILFKGMDTDLELLFEEEIIIDPPISKGTADETDL